jgi:hypothetical protein
MQAFACVQAAADITKSLVASDCSAQWLLRYRRPLWLKACTLKAAASGLTSVGRTTGIIESTATTTLGIGVAAIAGL